MSLGTNRHYTRNRVAFRGEAYFRSVPFQRIMITGRFGDLGATGKLTYGNQRDIILAFGQACVPVPNYV